MSNIFYEVNFDGLVGPTHHYAGLSQGNVASISNARKISNPKLAALQGLDKMFYLHQLGLKQGFIPPHPRPNLELLHNLGFKGSPTQQIEKAYKTAPKILSAAFAASAMWTANAATVSCAVDTTDGKTHFTPANLISNLHRHQEASVNAAILQQCFNDKDYFVHHKPLCATTSFSDEGAANHCRISNHHHLPGINIFIYGFSTFDANQARPQKFPARQSLEASQAIARQHGLNPENTLFIQQNPEAIDAGVFHHDVIGLSNEKLIIIHEKAFINQENTIQIIQKKLPDAHIFQVRNTDFTLDDAVQSYFFNSQLITRPNQSILLVAPMEARNNPAVYQYIESLLQKEILHEVQFFDLKQSMQNGGGPACLRLRVPLSEIALEHVNPNFLINEQKIQTLRNWVNQYYRDRLSFDDLLDPELLNELNDAYLAMQEILC